MGSGLAEPLAGPVVHLGRRLVLGQKPRECHQAASRATWAAGRLRVLRLALVALAVHAGGGGGRAFGGLFLAAAEVVPGVYERDVVLVPKEPYEVTVGIGQAKFLNFSCMGGPADVIISLSTYSEHADPLLFLSLDPDAPPSFQQHDASSFGQWREDAGGDHYVIAKSVSPKGGILGLVNMKHFAGEELRGILGIRCSFIIAFDTLFWEHLQSDAVCPVGGRFSHGQLIQSEDPCSGNGQCGNNGDCICNGDWTGPACEHSQSDFAVTAEGRYKFKVANGRYQYFRIKVPPDFSGGFLEVSVSAEAPVVLLVRGNGLPTKSNFELSNFDDWVNQRNVTTLRYKVAAADDTGPAYAPVGGRGDVRGRRLSTMASSPRSWSELFELAAQESSTPSAALPEEAPGISVGDGFQVENEAAFDMWDQTPGADWPGFSAASFSSEEEEAIVDVDLSGTPVNADTAAHGEATATPTRRLQDCQKVPMPSGPLCSNPLFLKCQDLCVTCMMCVERTGKSRNDASSGCTEACNMCVEPNCMTTLSTCVENVSCTGPEAEQCNTGCHDCMTCFDSTDGRCADCKCCQGCMPLAAKCAQALRQNLYMERTPPAQDSRRYVFVGVFNHRRYFLDKNEIHATATIKLTADPNFDREELPTSWIADLYNRFHDVRSLAITQQQIYPHGRQFVYELPLNATGTLRMKVNVFRERMTLLHLRNIGRAQNMVLDFREGPNITDVLTSSRAAPKTFFDFDRVHFTVGENRPSTSASSVRLGGHLSEIVDRSRHIEIFASGETAIWCAVFGAADGTLEVEARTYAGDFGMDGVQVGNGAASAGSSLDTGHILVLFVICGLVALACTYYRAHLFERHQDGPDPSAPFSERFKNLISRQSHDHESTLSLTRVGSLQGYIGSDEIDQSVEDQYLHRGGIGDDGI